MFTSARFGEVPIMLGVTVVIATRDRIAGLTRTLTRLAELPERPAVIVVDNGSTDGTVNCVRGQFPQVRVLALRHNAGATARNRGVAAARTAYVAFADDDSWWAPYALSRAYGLFEDHPRLALIAARTLVGPDERLDPMSAFMASAPIGSCPDLPGPTVLGFLACAAIVRRRAFLECGGFDPVVFFMGEEARLAYDLTAAGWGLAYCPDVVAHHHPSPGGGRGPKQRLAARNRALTAWMRRPFRTATAETAGFIRMMAKSGDYRALAGFAARLPRAVLRRRAPHPGLEMTLTRLADRERSYGYSTDAGPLELRRPDP
jgi:GT2 family glycosyltransferase